MSKALFKVEKPGLYTSIQDKGRFGYQHYGVPVSGAIDRYAHNMVNYILGNNCHSATIEVTIFGLELIVLQDCMIAITGADLKAVVDNKEAPMWKVFKVYHGQRIEFKKPITGVRAYLGVAGGIESELLLGSRSTFERGGLGSRLKKGDILKVASVSNCVRKLGLTKRWIPKYMQDIELRVIPSQHEEFFEEESVNDFYHQVYTLLKGDRMGSMIRGDKPLKHRVEADIISECTTFGTIQIPKNGQPIILLADSQTTGGYTTIGTIISVDLWKIAQLRPGGKINFKRIRLDEAEYLQRNWLKKGIV